MDLSHFHFLRPDWFWALIPAALLFLLVLRTRSAAEGSNWAKHVDAHLLKHLTLSGGGARTPRLIPLAAAVMIAILVLALAGPTWKKAAAPSFMGDEPVVLVLSLTQSMNADDLTPSRLRRGVHKVRDILARTEGDDRALVIYSDIPFVAAPLTNDPKVIEQMLPELSTRLMPVLGNRPDLALSEAAAVLKRAHAASGRIVLIADNAGDAAKTEAAAKAARQAGYTVSVLAVGTKDGSTLQTADGQAIATRSGKTITTALDAAGLRQVASTGGGAYARITANSQDLNKVVPKSTALEGAGRKQDFKSDTWVDMGYWLLVIPALLLPFAFRRGMVFGLGLMIIGLGTAPQSAKASTWDNLWATPDQQGQTAFGKGDYDAAAKSFETSGWKGSAAYRAGDYANAAGAFAGEDYNLGNALAKSGQLKEALAAYDRALKKSPEDADAKFNRDLIQKILDEQKKQEQQKQQQQQSSQDKNQQQNQQSSGQNSKPKNQQASNGSGQKDQKDQKDQGKQDQNQQDKSQRDQGQKESSKTSDGQTGSTPKNHQNSAQKDQQQKGQPQQQAGHQQQQASGKNDAGKKDRDAQKTGGKDQANNQTQAGQNGKSQAGKDQAGNHQKNADQQKAAQQQPGGQDGPAPSGTQEEAQQASQQQKPQQGPGAQQQATHQAGDHQEAGQPPQGKPMAPGQMAARAPEKKEHGSLSSMLSEFLSGNGDKDETGEQVEASVPGAPVTDQAVEQQLRRVPDDPSGLLKARIRQYYAQLRAGQQ